MEAQRKIILAKIFEVRKGTPQWIDLKVKLFEAGVTKPMKDYGIYIRASYDDGYQERTIVWDDNRDKIINNLQSLPVNAQKALLWIGLNQGGDQ